MDSVLEILQNFYREKCAQDLFTELTQLCQGPSEKSTDFVIRALRLRQNVFTTAAAEKKKYDVEFVQETFLNAVKSGLLEESVSTKVAHLLGKTTTKDQELLREVNVAEQESEERKKRHGKKKVTVAQAYTEKSDLDTVLKPLMEGMAKLTQQVAELQVRQKPEGESSRKSQSDNNKYRNNRQRRPDYRCNNCRAQNMNSCAHCYKCLETGHMAVDCQKSKNGTWSSTGGSR